MKKFLFILFMLILVSQVYAEVDHFYEIELEYKRERLSFSSIEVKPITNIDKIENAIGGYVAEVVAFDETRLDAIFFSIPLEILYDEIDPKTGEIVSGGILELEQSSTTIRVPYYENVKEINIYDIDINRLLTIDVSDYSKNRCGDGICQLSESYETCRQDCPSDLKDERPRGILEEKTTIEETSIKEKLTNYALIIFFISIVVIVIIFFILKQKKREGK